MRVWRKKNHDSIHQWWVQDSQLDWWYSNQNVLGDVYQWTFNGRFNGPCVFNERLEESSELTFLVLQGRAITETLPKQYGFI